MLFSWFDSITKFLLRVNRIDYCNFSFRLKEKQKLIHTPLEKINESYFQKNMHIHLPVSLWHLFQVHRKVAERPGWAFVHRTWFGESWLTVQHQPPTFFVNKAASLSLRCVTRFHDCKVSLQRLPLCWLMHDSCLEHLRGQWPIFCNATDREGDVGPAGTGCAFVAGKSDSYCSDITSLWI